jgi:hypothetical protein
LGSKLLGTERIQGVTELVKKEHGTATEMENNFALHNISNIETQLKKWSLIKGDLIHWRRMLK